MEAADLCVGFFYVHTCTLGICRIQNFLSVSECQPPEGKVKNCIGRMMERPQCFEVVSSSRLVTLFLPSAELLKNSASLSPSFTLSLLPSTSSFSHFLFSVSFIFLFLSLFLFSGIFHFLQVAGRSFPCYQRSFFDRLNSLAKHNF